jgi:dipeptidyl aminopeptidase/acylaminoacyl peptidase
MDFTIRVAGSPMEAQLALPSQNAGLPAVLLCPGLQRDVAALSFVRDALVDAGVAVLSIRYRAMDLLDDDEDCAAALDHLAAHPAIDADRIAMVGHSRGSMATLRTAAQDPRVKAAVAMQPVTDFLGYIRATRAYAPLRFDAMVGRFGGADPDLDPAPYERYSALTYADRIAVPTLLIAGTADMHSPVHHSVLMRDAIEATGKAKTGLEIIDGCGHFFELGYLDNCRDAVAALVVQWVLANV